MGGTCSREQRTIRAPVRTTSDNYMTLESCIGLPRDAYSVSQQLISGPGLVVPLFASSIGDMISLTKVCIAALSKNQMGEFKSYSDALRPKGASKLNFKQTPQSKNDKDSISQDTSPTGPEFTPFDTREDFRSRLQDLLKRMNIMGWEEAFLADFDAKAAADARKNNTNSPVSLAGGGRPQLPALPKSVNLGGGSEPYVLIGPAYLLVSNDVDNNFIEGYLYFPSMTAAGRPSPNYDFMGKSHQWLNRLLHNEMYVAKGKGCEQTCLGSTSEITQDKNKQCDTNVSYLSCGCRSDNPDRPACFHDPTKDTGEFKSKHYRLKETKHPGEPIYYQYVAYCVNIDHTSIKQFFTPDSPKNIVKNIIPSNWNVFTGCKYGLISNNGTYHSRLETTFQQVPGSYKGGTYEYMPMAKFGIYRNDSEDTVALCQTNNMPKRSTLVAAITCMGYPTRLTIEGPSLKLYVTDEPPEPIPKSEKVGWSIKIASDKAKQPIAMVLLDNGAFGVYDIENNDAISSAFTDYIDASLSNNDALLEDSGGDHGEYDPIADYQRRLKQLRDWLRIQNLLVEVADDKQSVTTTDTIVRLSKDVGGDVGTFTSYDPDVDYSSRLRKLVDILSQEGYKVADIPSVKHSDMIRGPMPLYDPEPTIMEFDPTADYNTRLQQLQLVLQRI